MEVDNRDRAIAVLRAGCPASRESALRSRIGRRRGRSARTPSNSWRHWTGRVCACRIPNGQLRDSYLDLFAADPNEAPVSGSAER